MTDEERKRLCERLCEPPKNDDEDVHRYELCVNAANEIERLATELANANRLLEIGRRRALEKSGGLEMKQSVAQSRVEPVGWQYRCRTNELSTWSEWRNCNQELADQLILKPPFYQVRRSPPGPDEQREPVAWRWRWHSDPPNVWNFTDNAFYSEDAVIEPLYAAKPPALRS